MQHIYTLLAGILISTAIMLTACSGGLQHGKDGYFKIGKPYEIEGDWYYPEENFSYSEVGTASWYGPNFHGKPTANGGVFSQYDVTAAHRTLPLPSIVKVENLENGKSLVVKVNDRGPYAKGRIIDLSKRSASLLDVIQKGTARVRVTYLPQETEKLLASLGITETHRKKERIKVAEYRRIRTKLNAQTLQSVAVKPTPVVESDIVSAAPAAVITSPLEDIKSNVFIQAGAFGIRNNAEQLAQKLLEYGASTVTPIDVKDKILYRVRMGPFDDENMAQKIMMQLSSIGLNASLVTD